MYNYRACGCQHCTRKAEAQELQQFLVVTQEFADILCASYTPDERVAVVKWSQQMVALAGRTTLVARINAYSEQRPYDQNASIIPPEGWDSA